jgi:hypothetical protein
MIELDPYDKDSVVFSVYKAVKLSGLSSQEIVDQLNSKFGVALSRSALSHVIHRGTIRLERAIQIFAVCGVTELSIRLKD